MVNSVLHRVKDKAYWEGVAWVEPTTTPKLLALPKFPHQRKINTEQA